MDWNAPSGDLGYTPRASYTYHSSRPASADDWLSNRSSCGCGHAGHELRRRRVMHPTTALSTRTFGFLLEGNWVTEGEPLEVHSSYDGSLVATTFRPTREHLETAIRAAVRAFEVTRKMQAYERQSVLWATAELVAQHRERLARTVAQEAAKPIKTARAEIERCVFTFKVAAEESVRIYGEYLPLDLQAATAGRWAIVRRFPLGPIASISPFNFPVNLVAHKW